MKRFVPHLLIAVLLFLATTFSGMAMFGMGANMEMGTAPCEDTRCPATESDHSMSNLECLTHCLTAASPDVSIPLALSLPLLLLAFVLTFFSEQTRLLADLIRERWKNALQKILLRQQLATIVIRD